MKKFFQDQRGANLVEYIILVGVVALMSIFAFRKFGFKVQGKVDSHSGVVSSDITNK